MESMQLLWRYRPLQKPPNALWGLFLLQAMQGKSIPQISQEIEQQFGVRILASALRRAARSDTGIGKERWKVLADYFQVQPYELHDPTLPNRLDPCFDEKVQKICLNRS